MVNKVFNRMMILQENSPVKMHVVVTTITGRHNGTVAWTDTDGKAHVRRWTERNIVEVVSELTAAVFSYLFKGEENILNPASFEDMAIIIRYEWRDFPKEYYHGFKDELSLDKWLKFNKEWLQSYERIV